MKDDQYKLFGIIATHSPSSCPFNNKKQMKKLSSAYSNQILVNHKIRTFNFYTSCPDHQFFFIIEAKNTKDVTDLLIELGIPDFNNARLFPLQKLLS